MSREIKDLDNLTEDEQIYLAQRGELPPGVLTADEQRELLDPARFDTPLLANTGDVNLGGVTTDELEVELEKRREVQDSVDTSKLMKPEGKEGASAPEEVDRPYTDWSKAELSTEILARNENLPDDEQLHVGGNKAELIEVLEADDERG